MGETAASDEQRVDFSAREPAVKHAAIVRCDPPLEGRLGSFHSKPFTFSARQRTWERQRTYLVLFMSGSGSGMTIRWLGAVGVARRTPDIDRNLEVFRVHELTSPLPFDEVIERLGSQRGRVSEANGPLFETMGPRVVSALLALRPGLTARLEELLAPRGRALSGEESERLALEKDAVGVILDIALDDARDMLLDWAPVQPGEPFLRGVRHRVAHENYLISHDATRFEDWLPLNTGEVDWRTFTKGGRSFRILNANNGPMERDLGIDLIYFNETLRSFVLVQYKKMTPGADGELWYRGDRRLDSQLERMRAIDNATSGVATSESDFRLYPMPCFLKLCEPYALVPDSEALIRGMYLARGHFEQFWSDTTLRGPKGGTRLGYRNVHRRLSNTQFTRLVKAAGSAAGVQRRKR